MVSKETRQEDEELREKLRHIDLEKLKTILKPLVSQDAAKKVHQKKRSVSKNPRK